MRVRNQLHGFLCTLKGFRTTVDKLIVLCDEAPGETGSMNDEAVTERLNMFNYSSCHPGLWKPISARKIQKYIKNKNIVIVSEKRQLFD